MTAAWPEDGRLVEPDRAGVEHVGELAERLVGKRSRGDEIAAAAARDVGRGDERSERVARMAAAHGRDVAVVEIEIADHDAVREHCEVVAGLEAAAEYGRALCCADIAGELEGDLARAGLIAADGAADGVEDGALDRAHDLGRQVLITQLERIVGKRLRDGSLIAGSRAWTCSVLRVRRQGRSCHRGARGRQSLQHLAARMFGIVHDGPHWSRSERP